jgi:uncharacterized membrane protein
MTRTGAPVAVARRRAAWRAARRRAAWRGDRALPWLLLAVLILAQIGYPLTGGTARARLTVATVVLGYLLSVAHALLSRGPRTTAALVLVTTGGGLAVEAAGVATGIPFGGYDYSGDLGPRLAGVPLAIPLAWTWMAWPAWLAAVRLARSRAGRIGLAGLGLAAWDVFLDPQMVAEGYWTWRDAGPALPGVPGVPVGNYLGWLLVAVLMMAVLSAAAGPAARTTAGGPAARVSAGEPVSGPAARTTAGGPAGGPAAGSAAGDAPMYALYLWTYASSVLAHAVFLDLRASAAWGALAMSAVAAPLAVSLARIRPRHRAIA